MALAWISPQGLQQLILMQSLNYGAPQWERKGMFSAFHEQTVQPI